MTDSRKKYLKEITSEILLDILFLGNDLIEFQYYLFMIDAIDTITYKPKQTRQNKKYLNALAQ